MTRNVSVVHVEDEHASLIATMALKLCGLVNTAISERTGEDGDYDTISKSFDELEGFNCSCRELVSVSGRDQTFRYIMIGDVEIPSAVQALLLDHTLFIIDVLRDKQDVADCQQAALQSIESAFALGGNSNNTIIYTALQGTDLSKIRAEHPDLTIVSKAGQKNINSHFSSLINKSLGHE